MKIISKILLVTLFASVSPLAIAAAVRNLYTATVEVNDQSLEQRKKGFAEALGKVLIKTTGSREIVTRTAVKDVLVNASDYMVEFAYLPLLPSLSDTDALGTIEAEPLMPLSVQFSKTTVDELMRKLDLPIWPANRPELLVWVVEQTALGYRFVDGDNVPGDLHDSFKRRGLPFQLPLYDLGDQMTLKPMAAWALNGKQLMDASKRYGLDHWVVLRYSWISNGGIRGSWYLSGRSGKFAGEGALLNTLQTDSTGDFFSNSVDQVVDLFARQMAYFANADTGVFRIEVENIGSFVAFSELNHFLSELEIINGINVRSIEGDTVVLDLDTEGEPQVLLRALNKERRLSRVTELGSDNRAQPDSRPVMAAVEHFRWQATH